MKFVCDSEGKLKEVAEKVLDLANEHTESSAFVVGLNGDLGSGKTTFTKQVAQLLGIKEDITSPTYVIQKNFDINHGRFKKLSHLDVYRLESEEELIPLQWQEIIENPENIVLIEWPEIIQNSLPKDILNLKFVFIDNVTREVEVQN